MPSSNPPKPPAQDNGANATIAMIALSVLLAASFALPSAVGTSVRHFALPGVALGIAVSFVLFRVVDKLQSETHARVREAEEDLEEALRRSEAKSTAHGASDDAGDSSGPASAEEASQSGVEDAVDVRQTRLTLSELWAVTHRRLDHYHGIALSQAKRSFRNAQAAMSLGFLLLALFVLVALNARTTAGSIVAGALGAVSAALAGFVSQTFIRSQEAAAGHLRAYFDQPLEFSRYLAAERLMADAGLREEQQAEILSQLLQAMITPSTGPMPPRAVESPANEP